MSDVHVFTSYLGTIVIFYTKYKYVSNHFKSYANLKIDLYRSDIVAILLSDP